MFRRIQRLRHLLSKRMIRSIIRWLQPGAERFYCHNGKLLCVSGGAQKYYCNICLGPAKRSEQCDRYACLNCDCWLENLCRDSQCSFCRDQSSTPKSCSDFQTNEKHSSPEN